MSDFALTPGERQHPLWLKLKAHLEERLAGHRLKNDNNLTQDETQKVRGRIAELKELLKLGEEPKTLPVEQHID